MKKLAMVVGLLVLVTASVFAQVGQTYYYQYIESVNDDTGVRSKGSDRAMYITFTKTACYESDAKGIKNGYEYTYQGEKNGQYVFLYRKIEHAEWRYTSNGGMFSPTTVESKQVVKSDYNVYLYFSKDYKRINKRYYHGKTETYGNCSFLYGMYSDFTTPGKDARWEKDVLIFEQTDPPKPKVEVKPEDVEFKAW